MYIYVIYTVIYSAYMHISYVCIMPFLEVTILFNQHLHYRGEYRGKIPDGHSNPIYSVLKTPKTPKFLTHFRPSRVFHVLQICRICM